MIEDFTDKPKHSVTIYADGYTLREITREDFSALHAFGSLAENVLYMGWGPNDEEGTRAFIKQSMLEAEEQPRRCYSLAISDNKDGRLIGSCGIHGINDKAKDGMLGWILHKDYHRKGIMPKVAAALIKFGFERLMLHRLYAYCDCDNYGSFRVMEKSGMRREGMLLQKEYNTQLSAWKDHYLYGILETEYFTRKNQ